MTTSRSERLAQVLKTLLWEEWDPIGVRGLGPDDEYDSYAMRILVMLNEGKSEQDVAAYLRCAATENMGLSDPGDCDRIAQRAVAIYGEAA